MRIERRFLGIGGVLLIVLAAWAWVSLDPFPGPDPRSALSIEARCGVAAGRALSSAELSITCGLDEAGIEAVVARTVDRFDLQALVEQVRADRLADPADLEALALELGLARETLVTLLQELDRASAGEPITPESFAATLLKRDDTGIALDIVTVVAPRSEHSTTDSDTGPLTPESSIDAGHMLTVRRDQVLEEGTRLQVACGAVAGDEVVLGRANITCGPEREDIESIVRRVVAEADISGLVDDLRGGRFNRAALVESLSAELHLSGTTILGLARRLAAADTPPDRLADVLATMFLQHTVLAHRIGELPDHEPAAQRVREEAAAAVAAGHYETAGILLDLWTRLEQTETALTQANHELGNVRHQLAQAFDQRNALEQQLAVVQRTVQASLQTDEPEAETEPEPTPDQQLDPGEVFASPDRVVLDVPPAVNAGERLVFAWQGPEAPEDLIFIARPDMAENSYFLSDRNRHRVEQGSPAQLVAPAEAGGYEVRYFSFRNGTVLARAPLDVEEPRVDMELPTEVNAGAFIKIPWRGPAAPDDLIFIAKPDMAGNRYPVSDRHRHRTARGSPAELVAPAEPGRYEVRYYSFSNGKVLKAEILTVR